MMTRLHYMTGAAALVLLTACGQQEPSAEADAGTVIKVTAAMENAETSRSATQPHLNSTGNHFTTGQSVALFLTESNASNSQEVYTDVYKGGLYPMTTNGSSPYAMTFNSGSYNWPGQNFYVNFYAWHPYVSGGPFAGKTSTGTTTFSVPADQSSATDYTNCDLMYAERKNVASTSSAVNLTFAHKLSRVVVTLQSTDNQITDEQLASATVEIQQNTGTPFYLQATVDIDAGAVTPLGASGTSANTLNMGTGSTTMAILPPGQTLTGKKVVFNMGLDGGANSYVITMDNTLEAGKNYQINLKLTLTHVEVTEKVTDWTAGTSFDNNITRPEIYF